MKKIFRILLTVATLLLLAPFVKAQERPADPSIAGIIGPLEWKDDGSTYTVDNTEAMVGYSKVISKPTSDGTYWIKLETFATGTASKVLTSKPSDIILVLDYSTSMNDSYGSISRKRALRNAVRAFLTKIHDNDASAREAAQAAGETYPGDRVAIVSFNEDATLRYGLTQISEGYTAMYNSYNDDPPVANYTNPADGLDLAMQQWQSGGSPTTDESRTRAVVVFTDGCPSWHYSYVFDSDYVAEAINNANELKSRYGASVYTIGLFDTGDSSWRTLGQSIVDYMNFLSSNFTGVTAACNDYPARPATNTTAINGTVTYSFTDYTSLAAARAADAYATQAEALAGDSDYFFMASDDPSSLESIFEKVAEQTAGTTNTSLSASTSTVDVVSHSFKLPDGANKNTIKVFTAKCTAANATTKQYSFDTEVLAPWSDDKFDQYVWDEHGNVISVTRNVDVDDAIPNNITVDVDNCLIEVEGFDYGNNFCGIITNEQGQPEVHGHKLIIMIPVKMNPNAVGGPNVETNGEGSGIIIKHEGADDESIIQFESPTVSLPVNLHIEKTGLRPGESAKFKISRQAEGDSGWEYVTSVFVTNGDHADRSDDNNPIVYVRGLPSVNENEKGFTYKVEEEPWTWSYEPTQPQLTNTGKVTNPFTFDNTKRDNIEYSIRHAESKATNTFKTDIAKNVEYDDSKENTGVGREKNQ